MINHRHYLILIGCIGVVLSCLLGCFDINFVRNIIGDALETVEDPDVSSAASANTRFGFKLLQDLREREPGAISSSLR